MPLTIVAHIHAVAGKEDFVRAELLKLIDTTRAEAGCLQYDLHVDNEDPRHFLFYENWENRDLWQTHMSAAHLAEYMKNTDGAVERFTLFEMERIG